MRAGVSEYLLQVRRKSLRRGRMSGQGDKHEDGRRWMWEKMEPCEDRSEEMGKEGLWLNMVRWLDV